MCVCRCVRLSICTNVWIKAAGWDEVDAMGRLKSFWRFTVQQKQPVRVCIHQLSSMQSHWARFCWTPWAVEGFGGGGTISGSEGPTVCWRMSVITVMTHTAVSWCRQGANQLSGSKTVGQMFWHHQRVVVGFRNMTCIHSLTKRSHYARRSHFIISPND